MEEVVKQQAAWLDVLGVDDKDIGSYLESSRLHRLLATLQDGVTAEGFFVQRSGSTDDVRYLEGRYTFFVGKFNISSGYKKHD